MVRNLYVTNKFNQLYYAYLDRKQAQCDKFFSSFCFELLSHNIVLFCVLYFKINKPITGMVEFL